MPEHPYRSLPNRAFWSRAVGRKRMEDVDPVASFALRIEPHTKVATAGSCFAQHIARHLARSGFNYFVAEQGHPVIPADLRAEYGYGTFSARYANIYTARQLRQLAERAHGVFKPVEGPWIDPDGSVRDPFRPAIQPGNFASVAEMEADRAQHLTAVRTMLEELDVFVFTLGLTECWECRADGAVLPICPGVQGGEFDPARYAFRNQDVTEVVDDMAAFLKRLRKVNPEGQVILTVSPVPLAATAREDAHVLAATTYSKSVLRVAAEMLNARYANVHYFPSFEIVTGNFNRGRYFADDLRNPTEDGVSHVMKLFLAHAASMDRPVEQPEAAASARDEREREHTKAASDFVEVECEEAFLDMAS